MTPHLCDGHTHDDTEYGDDGPGRSLRSSIDFPNVTCLNEEHEHAGRSILKLHEERFTATPFLSSPEGDPELLLIVPFVESVSILSITIQSTIVNTSFVPQRQQAPPRTVRLFTNRDDLDFETARELPPQMELQLVLPDHVVEGTTIDYPCRPAGRFQNITCLALLVVDNYHYEEDDNDESSTIISYIGFKGKSMNVRRRAVEAVYETQGMPADHVANMEATHSFVG
jgi:PITH domain